MKKIISLTVSLLCFGTIFAQEESTQIEAFQQEESMQTEALKRQQEQASTLNEIKELLISAQKSKNGTKWDARLIDAKEVVWVRPENGKWKRIKTDGVISNVRGKKDDWMEFIGILPLKDGDRIDTGKRSSTAQIILDRKNIFAIGQNTIIEIKSFSHNNTIIALRKGSVIGSLGEIKQSGKKFTIVTPNAYISIKNGKFCVKYKPSKTNPVTKIGIFEDSAATVTKLDNGVSAKEIELESNKEAVVSKRVKFIPYKLVWFEKYQDAAYSTQINSLVLPTAKEMTEKEIASIRGRMLSAGKGEIYRPEFKPLDLRSPYEKRMQEISKERQKEDSPFLD
ncbi:MAG TPA: hypothetical protein VMW66_02990 [Elusimicrobiales bacterium]|nr:hypothetical protein [Elusimicrobiales bacterium]